MRLGEILASVFLLIGLYLFLSRPESTVPIIQAIGGYGVKTLETLQGRG